MATKMLLEYCDTPFSFLRGRTSGIVSLFLTFVFLCGHIPTAYTQELRCPEIDLVDIVGYSAYRTVDIGQQTCGLAAPEEYQALDATELLICNNSIPASSFPLNNMLDKITSSTCSRNPVFDTYWQTKNTVPTPGGLIETVTIVVNFTDPFEIHNIRLVFGALTSTVDGRPKALVYEKYDPQAISPGWVQMRYEAVNCASTYAGVSTSFTSPTQPYCVTRPDGSAPYVSVFWPKRDYSALYNSDISVRRFFTTSAIRIRLETPASAEPLRSYYQIADIGVVGSCACFGHSTSCLGPNAAECNCGGNTEGTNCERCLPLYNNKTWEIGPTFQCEPCDCNAYAQSCHYDNAKGYGVCDNCEENTIGEFCESCDAGYYRNPSNQNPRLNTTGLDLGTCSGFDGTAVVSYACSNWCIPCDCNVNGTVNGDASCDMSGQCNCKTNVIGRRCDQCNDGFWDLRRDSLDGCRACSCDIRGTRDNLNLCDNSTGLCICKTNVAGDRCDQCKSGAYDLNLNNPDGCTLCDCDPGGSTNDVCGVSGGQCSCRSQISGRDCRDPLQTFYVPKLDFYIFEAEFVTPLSDPLIQRIGHGTDTATASGQGFVSLTPQTTITFTASVMVTHLYNLIIRYETAFTWPGVQVFVTMDGGNPYTCNGQNYVTGQQFTQTLQIPNADSKGGIQVLQACLSAGESYAVLIRLANDLSSNIGASFLIDSIVFLPDITTLAMYPRLDNQTQTTALSCYEGAKPVSSALRLDAMCSRLEFSAMSELLNGAIACSCTGAGVVSGTSCDAFSGQCQCKPGVMLSDCSMCKVFHYDQTLFDGCIACNCNPDGSQQLSCNSTGQCECKTNVIGDKCDSCMPDHFGLATGNGCQQCTCNDVYSVSNACDDTGQCPCKTGVSGLQCDVCTDGWYNLTTDGCTSCGCDPDGSTPAACNKQTGVCQCKLQTQGNTCNECKLGHYGLGPWHTDGCLQCICSSHSANCTSAPGYYETVASSSWILSNPTAVDERWLGGDESGRVVVVDNPTVLFSGKTVAQYVMQIKNSPEYLQSQALYFLAPSKYLGDKRSAYGRSLDFALSYSEQTGLLQDTLGDVVLQGVALTYSLVDKLSATPGPGPTEYRFNLREGQWKVDRTDGIVATFQQVLETLSNLEAIKIRAKFGNKTDSVGNLYSGSLSYSSRDNSSGIPVNNVEECFCPLGYTGQFCDQCAPNYRRVLGSPGSFGNCEPCQCNNHDLSPCDSETGKCQCTHNTAGDHCERCMSGFYGNALQGSPNDCSPCMCPGNVIDGAVNSFASQCDGSGVCVNCSAGHQGPRCETCVTGYYGMPENATNNGGRCEPCFCNGRADTCDSVTGICTDCRNNTAGKECQICKQPYFGDAMSLNCELCNCSSVGATGECDPSSGQCYCKPNVIGFSCDQCAINTFNYSSGSGCTPCDCHILGSETSNCNVITGQCQCALRVTGRQCDSCEDTFFDITSQGCRACGCMTEGTANITGQTFGTCDLYSGQCTCAIPGIIGKTCDHCSKASKNTYTYIPEMDLGIYPNCELCGECYDNWAAIIDQIGFDNDALNNEVQSVWANYDYQLASSVEQRINNSQNQLLDAQQGVMDIQSFVTTLKDLTTGYAGVKTEVDQTNSGLDTIDTDKSRSQAELDSLRHFDGSSITPDGATKSLTELLSDINAEDISQQSLFSQGEVTFNNLKGMSDTARTADQQIVLLQQRVTAAKTDLGTVSTSRTSAENSVGLLFETTYQDNQGRLQGISTDLNAIEGLENVAKQNVALAESLIDSCNTTMGSAEVLVQQKRDNTFQAVTQMQTASQNASEAQRLSTSAESQVKVFLDIATLAKADLTKAVTDLAEGQKLINLANGNVATSRQQVQEIQAILLRPLTDMQAITANIRDVIVPAQQVTTANADANSALLQAQQTEQLASEAVTQSRLAQQELDTIRSNLDESAALTATTQALITEADTMEATISGVIASVNNKASTAHQLALKTEGNANKLSLRTASVNDCLTSALNHATVTSQVAQNAAAVQNSAEQQHNTNRNIVSNISATLNVLTTRPGFSLAVEANNAIDSLIADLEAVGGTTELENILDTLANQQQDMTTLESEITRLESDIEVIIGNLGNFDPANTGCVAN